MELKEVKEVYKNAQKTKPSYLLKFLAFYIVNSIRKGMIKSIKKGNYKNKKIFNFPVISFLLSRNNENKLRELVLSKLKENYPNINFSNLWGKRYKKSFIKTVKKECATKYERELKDIFYSLKEKKRAKTYSLVNKELNHIENLILIAANNGEQAVRLKRTSINMDITKIVLAKLKEQGFNFFIHTKEKKFKTIYNIKISGWD